MSKFEGVLRCKDCKKEFPITEADRDVPLSVLIEQGKIDGGHVWNFKGKKYALRHGTEEDYEDFEGERG